MKSLLSVSWLIMLLAAGCTVAYNTVRRTRAIPVQQSRVNVSPGSQRGAAIATTPIQTRDDSTSWKVHTSVKYGYEISYPSVGTLDASNPSRVFIAFSQPFDVEGSRGIDEFSFCIAVHNNPAGIPSRVWAQKVWEPDFIRAQQDIRINGVLGYRVTIFEFDQNTEHIYVSKGSAIYELSFWNPETMSHFAPALRKHYDALFQRMLNSFRLQKPQS